MRRTRHVDIAMPSEISVQDGLAYALYLPPDSSDGSATARGGVVIIHGARSCKESHFDFARACRSRGLAALVYDQRGHGDSGGELGASTLEDVSTVAALLPPGPVFLRGSSLGGFLALAAAESVAARGVVAICPASAEGLLRALRGEDLRIPVDRPALVELISAVDLPGAAAALGEDLMLQHAEGDEQVPVEHSARLHAAAPGSRFVAVPGGHHRSVQHDNELQGVALRFFEDRVG